MRLRILQDILLGYLLLLPNLIVFTSFWSLLGVFEYVVLIFLMFWNGLVFHYISLFIHSGAHYEFAKRHKKLNDLLTNFLVGYPLLISVKAYRRKHFQHHKYIGTLDDAENSYAYALNFKNLMNMTFFIIAAEKVLSIYFKNDVHGAKLSGEKSYLDFFLSVIFFTTIQLLLFFAFVHIGNMKAYFFTSFIPIFMLLPVIGWLRSAAEHRAIPYISTSDIVSRNFKLDFLGFFLGPAGFRNHDLHHMFPGIHYLDLNWDKLCSHNRLSQDSYGDTIWRLIRADARQVKEN